VKKKRKIRLMIVDDHPAFRTGLSALIESEPDLSVVAKTGDGRSALELYRRERPDVVLMDLRLPEFSGVEAIMGIRKEFPDCRVIVLTTYDSDEDIYRAIQSGAKSYLLKDMSKDQIVETIRAVDDGEQPLPPGVASRLAERQKREELSQKEMEVLQLLVKARSNKEIASELFISEDTVKFHLKGLFTKLGVRDRTEAAISAVRLGIVQL
jgi:two-component system NarL family response regulator